MKLRLQHAEWFITWRPGNGARMVVTLALITVVPLTGMIHFLAGPTIELSAFYLIPVVLAAWYVGTRMGMLIALLAVADWFVVETQFAPRDVQLGDDVFNAVARLVVFLVVVGFIHLLREALDRANGLARVDPLTQLLNVQALHELGNLELRKAARQRYAMTAMFIDLDEFKSVNDSLGHRAGDAVLCAFAQALRAGIRATDLAARVGGDEFLVVMPDTGPDVAASIAANLRAQLLDAMHSGGWSVTFSLGVSTFLRPPAAIDDLVNRADAMMYRVKDLGKNAIAHEVVPA